MKKILSLVLVLAMVLAFAACTKKPTETKVDPNAKSEGTLTHAQYLAAEEGSDVTVEGFITAVYFSEAYKNYNIVLQDGDGAYYVYRMPGETKDEKLVVGQKVKVTGVRASWSGEVELKEGTATYEVVEGQTYTFENVDITEDLKAGNDVIKYQNMKVSCTLEVVSPALYKHNGSGEHGDDLYVTVKAGDKEYVFVVESDFCDGDSATYKTVEALTAGETIKTSGILYWYNGPQMWLMEVSK